MPWISRDALPLAVVVAALGLVTSACQAVLEPRPAAEMVVVHEIPAPSRPHAAAVLQGRAAVPEAARRPPEAAVAAVEALRRLPRRVPLETGIASWYGPGFAGRTTANGEIYDPMGMTAAHPNLPLGSEVVVVNLANGREVRLRINDRGPFIGTRVIDVSKAAAKALGFYYTGLAEVRIDRLEPGEPAERQANADGTIVNAAVTDR